MSRSTATAPKWHNYHPELEGITMHPAKADHRPSKSKEKRTLVTAAPPPTAIVPLQFESPESSTIHSAEYDPQTMLMSVLFKRPKAVLDRYDYDAFPAELWEKFTQAPSKGAFFSAYIRPFYTGRHIVR